jgi:hypothetical protein
MFNDIILRNLFFIFFFYYFCIKLMFLFCWFLGIIYQLKTQKTILNLRFEVTTRSRKALKSSEKPLDQQRSNYMMIACFSKISVFLKLCYFVGVQIPTTHDSRLHPRLETRSAKTTSWMARTAHSDNFYLEDV